MSRNGENPLDHLPEDLKRPLGQQADLDDETPPAPRAQPPAHAESDLLSAIEMELAGDLGAFEAQLTCEPGAESGLYDVRLRVSASEPAILPTLTLSWKLPSVDFHYKWNPRCYQNRALDPSVGTANFIQSKANSGMPAYSLYNLDGVNACTWALSDAIHDTETGGAYRHGKVYECRAVIYGDRMDATREYDVTLRFDFRRIPYYEALRDVSAWWEEMPEYAPCISPEAARAPLLSSWYSYKLDVDPDDLETQCALAKELGMDTVILDDGWQTDQTDFGYQNNGDWEVSVRKFPDFAGHVKRVQDLGMKYMVWFSVPFVGIESKAYPRFKEMGMLMPAREGARWFSLDMRYPQTRAYLAEIYENFVRRYGVDGLKMDFVGSVGLGRDMVDSPDDRRDCVSIGEGVCRLLDDVMARLRAIRPEILIEFRQIYVGPAMRKYGNMFRAVDCPNSIGDNRVRTLDLRLLCGATAVHADPITWHDDDPVDSAAMQIIHAMFSVPQISRKMTELTEPHRRMLRRQLAFCREHADVLQEGLLRPMYPHMLYPLVMARTDKKLLGAFYSSLPLKIDEVVPEQLLLVNGSYCDELLIDLAEPLGPVLMTVTACTGELLAEIELDIGAGLHRLAIPPAASAVVRRKIQ
jgi:alpha-galactosidase